MLVDHTLRAVRCCCFIRRGNFHSAIPDLVSVDKNLLLKLRKKTGYAFIKCKEALEVNSSNELKAEEWLHKQATVEGWAKVKQDDRITTQGLIGLITTRNFAAMLEVNCETDFVSRNARFCSLVATLTKELMFSHFQNVNNDAISKIAINNEQLNALETKQGVPFGDCVAQEVSHIGENIRLRRAACYHFSNVYHVLGCVHPLNTVMLDDTSVLLGRYGTLAVFQQKDNSQFNEAIAQQICKHIIGMNPYEIGDLQAFLEEEKDLLKQQENSLALKEEAWENIVADDEYLEHQNSTPCKPEGRLLYQEFILEPDKLIGHMLQDAGSVVLDFVRYECGQN